MNKNNLINNILSIDNVKKNILVHYGLDDSSVEMVKFKDTDKQRAVYKVTFKGSSYCLKKVYYKEGDLLYVYSAMEWLYRNDILVPKLLPTLNKSRYINYNNMLFILTPWVNGEKCNFDNEEHIYLSIKTLAKLHKSSSNFIPISGSTPRKGYSNLNASLEKHYNQIIDSAKYANLYKDKFSKLFLSNLDPNFELAKLSLEISSSIKDSSLSKSLCHGDFVNKNIIIDIPNVWVIDFDKCQEDYSAKDLSYFLRRLLKRDKTNWNKELFLSIITQYMDIHPFSECDLKYILAYIIFPQKFWRISRDYYKNIKKCNKASFYTLLENAVSKSYEQLKFAHEVIYIFEKYYNVKF